MVELNSISHGEHDVDALQVKAKGFKSSLAYVYFMNVALFWEDCVYRSLCLRLVLFSTGEVDHQPQTPFLPNN